METGQRKDAGYTVIRVSTVTRDRLKTRGMMGDTYDDVIERLLRHHDDETG